MFEGAFKQRGDGTSHRERIIESLRAHPEGADDDELADGLKIPQCQTVNARCRKLLRRDLSHGSRMTDGPVEPAMPRL